MVYIVCICFYTKSYSSENDALQIGVSFSFVIIVDFVVLICCCWKGEKRKESSINSASHAGWSFVCTIATYTLPSFWPQQQFILSPVLTRNHTDACNHLPILFRSLSLFGNNLTDVCMVNLRIDSMFVLNLDFAMTRVVVIFDPASWWWWCS